MKRYHSKKLILTKRIPAGTVLFENSTPGSEIDFVVPRGVKQMYFDVRGACGYGGSAGGRVTGLLQVPAGTVLHFTTAYTKTDHINPQYNASDIRIPALNTTDFKYQRIVTAGGGGSHSSRGAAGGIGGGLEGARGNPGYRADAGGAGGTQTAGGAGGMGQPVSIGHYHNGNAGDFGYGGTGISCGYCGQTGAGGAGWYGGGSGAGDWNKNGGYAAGGGGGSSYTNPIYCSEVTHYAGVSATGYILITAA